MWIKSNQTNQPVSTPTTSSHRMNAPNSSTQCIEKFIVHIVVCLVWIKCLWVQFTFVLLWKEKRTKKNNKIRRQLAMQWIPQQNKRKNYFSLSLAVSFFIVNIMLLCCNLHLSSKKKWKLNTKSNENMFVVV